jgi:hypothetical protein
MSATTGCATADAREAGGTTGLTVDDHERAMTEVSFLLDIFASTVDELMGGASAPVGRAAGRQAAARMPLHLPDPTLETVLQSLRAHMARGYAMTWQQGGTGAQVSFDRCVVREACQRQGQQPGGALCRLFHFYLDGVVNGLLHRPVKSTDLRAGHRCTIRLETK